MYFNYYFVRVYLVYVCHSVCGGQTETVEFWVYGLNTDHQAVMAHF